MNARMLYTIQRGHWYSIVLDVHAAAESKHDIQRTAFMRNYSTYSVSFLNVT